MPFAQCLEPCPLPLPLLLLLSADPFCGRACENINLTLLPLLHASCPLPNALHHALCLCPALASAAVPADATADVAAIHVATLWRKTVRCMDITRTPSLQFRQAKIFGGSTICRSTQKCFCLFSALAFSLLVAPYPFASSANPFCGRACGSIN